MELRAGIFEKINSLLDDEEAMRQLDNYLSRLNKQAAIKVEKLRPYTLEELDARIDEAEAEIEAGEVMTNEEVFANMERKYPWLCK